MITHDNGLYVCDYDSSLFIGRLAGFIDGNFTLHLFLLLEYVVIYFQFFISLTYVDKGYYHFCLYFIVWNIVADILREVIKNYCRLFQLEAARFDYLFLVFVRPQRLYFLDNLSKNLISIISCLMKQNYQRFHYYP